MNKKGKLISVFSAKGGVGKTIFLLNMAGIFCTLGKKVLLLDMDLYSGGIGISLGVNSNKTLYNVVKDMKDEKYTDIENYISKYNDNIDVLMSPIDPRESYEIDIKHTNDILNIVSKKYDIILIDTDNAISDVNFTIMNKCDTVFLIITNDPIDIKNAKSVITVLNDIKNINYKVILNNSRDDDKDYLTIFDIKSILKNNIDFTISSSFHIKNIDKYTLNKEILTLNSSIISNHKKDIDKFKLIANSLISGD